MDALAIHGYAQLGVALTRALKDREADFDRRLSKATRTLVRFAAKHPVLLSHMFAAKNHPAAPAEILEASERALSPGLQVIADGQATGDVVAGDPELLALVPFAVVQGLIVISNHGSFKGISVENLVEEATRRVIVGLRPRP